MFIGLKILSNISKRPPLQYYELLISVIRISARCYIGTTLFVPVITNRKKSLKLHTCVYHRGIGGSDTKVVP